LGLGIAAVVDQKLGISVSNIVEATGFNKEIIESL
jgi:hypothetical protein